jgi:hypothetical protein
LTVAERRNPPSASRAEPTFATLPIARRASSVASTTSPPGFVITPSALLSVHYEPLIVVAISD